MSNYDEKFASFIRMCAEAKRQQIERVVVSHPSVLGDTYTELIESLSRLADVGLALSIASRGPSATVTPIKPSAAGKKGMRNEGRAQVSQARRGEEETCGQEARCEEEDREEGRRKENDEGGRRLRFQPRDHACSAARSRAEAATEAKVEGRAAVFSMCSNRRVG